MNSRLIFTFFATLFFLVINAQNDSLYRKAIEKADAAYDFRWSQSADSFTDRDKFLTAEDLYTRASFLKPDEPYPSARISEIKRILNDLGARQTYQRWILAADSLLNADSYSKAQRYYVLADSVYSTPYSKARLSSVYALSSLAEGGSNSIDSIKYGTSFGECDGYCFNELKITAELTTRHSKKWGQDSQDKINTLKTGKKDWNSVTRLINLRAFYKLSPTIGCPDCADGGAEWIEISIKSNTYTVEFEYAADVYPLHDLLKFLRQSSESFSK